MQAEGGGRVVGVPLDTGQLSRQMRLKKMASGVDVAREVGVAKLPSELLGAGIATHRQPAFDEVQQTLKLTRLPDSAANLKINPLARSGSKPSN